MLLINQGVLYRNAGAVRRKRQPTSICESESLDLLNKLEGVRLAPSSEGFLFLILSVVLLLLRALLLFGDSLSLLNMVTTLSSSARRGVSGLSSVSSVLRRIQLLLDASRQTASHQGSERCAGA